MSLINTYVKLKYYFSSSFLISLFLFPLIEFFQIRFHILRQHRFLTPRIAPSNAISRWIHADSSISCIFSHAALAPVFFNSSAELIPTCINYSSTVFPIFGNFDNSPIIFSPVYLYNFNFVLSAYDIDIPFLLLHS